MPRPYRKGCWQFGREVVYVQECALKQRQRNNPRPDTTLNAAVGCAAAIALLVVAVLLIYLWTL